MAAPEAGEGQQEMNSAHVRRDGTKPAGVHSVARSLQYSALEPNQLRKCPMNRLCTQRMHRMQASEDSWPNACRPIRMQAAGWSRGAEGLTGLAWRKAFGRRAIWRRAAIAGLTTTVLSGAAGAGRPLVFGLLVLTTTLLTQFWHHVDDWRETARTWLN